MKAPRPTAGMVSFASVARRVDRAPQTLLRWIAVGEFPRPITINKRRYFWPEQINAWLDQAYASTSTKPNDDGNRAVA